MAFQFDKPTYAIGIEKNALKTHKEYKCIIGKEKLVKYVTYDEALGLVQKYGESKILRQKKENGKWCFILPVKDLRDE